MGSERALGLRLASCGNQSSRETGVSRIGSSLTAVAVTKDQQGFAYRILVNAPNWLQTSGLCARVVDLVLMRRSAAPRRGVRSPPEQELLGAMTSLGPSRECYKPSRKSRGRTAKTVGAPTAEIGRAHV